MVRYTVWHKLVGGDGLGKVTRGVRVDPLGERQLVRDKLQREDRDKCRQCSLVWCEVGGWALVAVAVAVAGSVRYTGISVSGGKAMSGLDFTSDPDIFCQKTSGERMLEREGSKGKVWARGRRKLLQCLCAKPFKLGTSKHDGSTTSLHKKTNHDTKNAANWQDWKPWSVLGYSICVHHVVPVA